MGKFDGILICTDLDGTLLKNDKSISKENLDSIEYFKSEGGKFTFVTGRMPFFVGDLVEKVKPNLPFGCINGGGIYDHVKNEYIFTVEIESDVLDLVEAADKAIFDLGIQVNVFDKIYFCKDNLAAKEFRRVTSVPNITAHYREISEPIAKIVFCDHREENIILLEKVLRAHHKAHKFDFIRSERALFEILPKGVNKGTVLAKMAEIFGMDKNKTVALGDFNNDIEMIKTAKAGVAVANAQDEVKAVADYITVSNEESAVAKVIEDIESGKIKF